MSVKMVSTTGHEIDPQGVNHPVHYNAHPSGVEVIEVVRHMNFNVGSAFKYMMRLGIKVEGDLERDQMIRKDLGKIIWYLEDERTNGIPANRQRMSGAGLKAVQAMLKSEPDLMTQQFMNALFEYHASGDQGMLDYALDITLAKQAAV